LMAYVFVVFLLFFFFSSRRRHTRFSRDWSSDVCSSDLDQLIIECTVGTNIANLPGQTRHLSINGVEEMISKMKEIGAITEKTAICATHFTHQHCPNHEELSAILKNIGVQCAYDGLVLHF